MPAVVEQQQQQSAVCNNKQQTIFSLSVTGNMSSHILPVCTSPFTRPLAILQQWAQPLVCCTVEVRQLQRQEQQQQMGRQGTNREEERHNHGMTTGMTTNDAVAVLAVARQRAQVLALQHGSSGRRRGAWRSQVRPCLADMHHKNSWLLR